MVKNPPARAGVINEVGSIPGLGRSPGRGHGNPLQYSCLENSMDRGVWWPTVHGSQRVGHDRADLACTPPHLFPCCAQMSVLYICFSVATLKTGSSVPFFKHWRSGVMLCIICVSDTCSQVWYNCFTGDSVLLLLNEKE